MVGLLTTGAGAQVADQLSNLLKIVSDPEASKKAIADLQAAETAASEASAKAAADTKTLSDLDASLKQTSAHLEDVSATHAEREKTLDAREAAIKEQENQVATLVSECDARETRMNQRFEQRAAELDGRENDLNTQHAKVLAEVAQREQTVAEREAGAKAMADDAHAMKQDYEARLAKILNAATS